MRKFAKVFVLVAVSVPIFFACGNTGKKEQDAVLAVVEGERITESMFRKEAENLPPYIRPIVETKAGRMQFLDSLITRDLLMREALRRGLDRRDEVRSRFEQARKSILLEALLRETAESAPGMSDEVLRKHYEENKARFEEGERVRVRHILFKDEGQAVEMARRAKKGEPFEQLMGEAEAADGKTADLGLIERGAFDKEFEDAAFGAPENSIVGPVKTIYGYHILQVLEKRPAGLPPFEEVKENIAAELREGAQREAFENLVNKLKKQAKIHMEGTPSAGGQFPDSPPGGKEVPAAGGIVPQGDR
ncbi:MAG TPA: peptidyl-prolyl cis-trans isomerase [Candidatus Limnocylindria bacterium]|nr:peptidyl-prolyl cis-trans isomerase [Candidatus Limnocylindria bacterium]